MDGWMGGLMDGEINMPVCVQTVCVDTHGEACERPMAHGHTPTTCKCFPSPAISATSFRIALISPSSPPWSSAGQAQRAQQARHGTVTNMHNKTKISKYHDDDDDDDDDVSKEFKRTNHIFKKQGESLSVEFDCR